MAILKWNDTSTYYGGAPPKFYQKGDAIPAHLFTETLLEQHLRYGKLKYEKAPRIPKVKLSISVMAHPSRESFFPGLREKLGDVPFAIDQKNNLAENSKAAWLLHDPEADFHVVIQDDGIVCNNFRNRAEEFLTDMESERIANNEPIQAYSFFVVQICSDSQMVEYKKQGFMIEPRNRGGVAICLPVSIIKPMLKYYDTLTDRHDDERIGRYLMNNCIRSCYSIPCLVDHNDHTPGLAGNGDHNGRVSGLFIDDQKFTIPKMIHQIWIGPDPAPWKWMKTWREKNPGWLYHLWTEKDIRETKWVNQRLIDYYWSKKMWHGVKDVCQYEILYTHGGCFFDADAECLDSINGLFSDCYEGYSCYENEKVRNGLVSPLLAAPAGSKFAKELIDGLSNITIPADDSPWKVTGNRYMGEMVKKTACNIHVFPSHYFLPEHFTGEKYEGKDKIYSKHHWGTTLDNYAKGVL